MRAEGAFRRGDIVEVRDPEGTRVAVGISHYDADEIARIQGERSDQIAAILGYELTYAPASSEQPSTAGILLVPSWSISTTNRHVRFDLIGSF